MKSEYKRDMNHNYLILTGEEAIDTNSYQVRMIVANAVPDSGDRWKIHGVLRCDFQAFNDCSF